MKCKYCRREMPNKTWATKNGCLWCDISKYTNACNETKDSVYLYLQEDIMKKIKVIKKVIKSQSHFSPKKNKETIYYHIYVGKDGKKYCIDGDTLK